MNCEKAQQLLIEYIEGSLENEQASQFLSHTKTCDTCQSELLAMQQTITQATASKVPQPDDAFFSRFPDQVLNGYKAQAQVQAHAKQSKQHAVRKPGLLALLQNWWLDTSWPNLAAQAMVVILAIGGTFMVVQDSSEPSFNSSGLYAQLETNPALGKFIENSHNMQATNNFGFADKPATVTSYLAGRLYSESLLMVVSGKQTYAVEHLTKIQSLLGDKDKSAITQNIQQQITIITQGKMSTSDKLASLAKLRSRLEANIQRRGKGHLALFRAGSWLVDIKLIAMAGSLDRLKQASQAQYIIDSLSELRAPKSIIKKLEKIRLIMSKTSISGPDADEINTLADDLQQLLG